LYSLLISLEEGMTDFFQMKSTCYSAEEKIPSHYE